eukprot:COSAG02_NODE_19489_length_879_cov_1.256410_2_plen_134_part_01
MGSGVIDQLGLPMELLSELVAVVHTTTTAHGAMNTVTGFLGQLVGVLPKTLWCEAGSEDLLQAIVAAGCDAIVKPLHPSSEGGGSVQQPTQTAFEMFSILADTLPPLLFLNTATCVMAMLLRAIESNALNEVR